MRLPTARTTRWLRLTVPAATGFTTLLLLTALAFAFGKFAALTRFTSDPTLAPRDIAIYKEDVNRVAGAGFLMATKIGKEQLYADETVTTSAE